MKKTWGILRTGFTSTLLLALLAGAAEAQSFTIKYGMADDAKGNVTYVSHNAVRIQTDQYDVINRLDSGNIVYLNHSRKTYKEMSAADMKAMLAKQKQRMDAEMNNPQYKEHLRKLGRSEAATLTKVGSGGNVAGYATDKYLLKGPTMDAELWITQSLQFPAAYYRDFNIANAVSTPFGGWDKVMELHGVVLKRVVSVGGPGGMKITETASSVDRSSVPASNFEVPAGYKKEQPR